MPVPCCESNYLFLSYANVFCFIRFYFQKRKEGQFISNKIKRLLLPTFIFFILGAVFLLVFSDESFITILRKFLFIDGECPFNAPCWYFITLFQLTIAAYLMNLDKLSYLLKVFVIVIAFVLGLIIYEFEIFIPFGINRTVIAMVFFASGALIGQIDRENRNSRKIYLKFLAVRSCIILWFVCGVVLNSKVSFYRMNLGNYLFFIVAGICGAVLYIELCKLLQKTRIKSFLIKTSNNSILIIGTHYFLISVFESITGPLELFKTAPYCLLAVGYTIFIVYIYNCVAPLLDKHFPFITGNVR